MRITSLAFSGSGEAIGLSLNWLCGSSNRNPLLLSAGKRAHSVECDLGQSDLGQAEAFRHADGWR
jgi:hypothetical protein